MLLYGLPETIAVYPATRTRREYQIWTYPHPDSSTQVAFIGGDGDGHFTPVHTTLPGAMALGWERNEDWRQQLPWGSVAEKVSAPTTPPAVPGRDPFGIAVPSSEIILPTDSLPGDTALVRAAGPDTLLMDATLGDTTMEDTTLNRRIPDETGQIDTPAAPRSVQTSDAPAGDTLTVPQSVPDTAGVDPTPAP